MYERYPLPIKYKNCGRIMRPVHKHRVPDMPETYFCTFCETGYHVDDPRIKFNTGEIKMDTYNPSEFFSAEHRTKREELLQTLTDEEVAFVLSQLSGRTEEFWLNWLKRHKNPNLMDDKDLEEANFEL